MKQELSKARTDLKLEDRLMYFYLKCVRLLKTITFFWFVPLEPMNEFG